MTSLYGGLCTATKKGVHDYFKIVIYSEQVHTPAPDFFELKPVLRPGQVQAVDESRSERSQLPTLWRKDVPGDGAYYKNKPFHQGNLIFHRIFHCTTFIPPR